MRQMNQRPYDPSVKTAGKPQWKEQERKIPGYTEHYHSDLLPFHRDRTNQIRGWDKNTSTWVFGKEAGSENLIFDNPFDRRDMVCIKPESINGEARNIVEAEEAGAVIDAYDLPHQRIDRYTVSEHTGYSLVENAVSGFGKDPNYYFVHRAASLFTDDYVSIYSITRANDGRIVQRNLVAVLRVDFDLFLNLIVVRRVFGKEGALARLLGVKKLEREPYNGIPLIEFLSAASGGYAPLCEVEPETVSWEWEISGNIHNLDIDSIPRIESRTLPVVAHPSIHSQLGKMDKDGEKQKAIRFIIKDAETGSRLQTSAIADIRQFSVGSPFFIEVEVVRVDENNIPLSNTPDIHVGLESMYGSCMGGHAFGIMDSATSEWGEIGYQLFQRRFYNESHHRHMPLSSTGDILLLDSEYVYHVNDEALEGAISLPALVDAFAVACDSLVPRKGLSIHDFVFFGNENLIPRDAKWLQAFSGKAKSFFKFFRLDKALCSAKDCFIAYRSLRGHDKYKTARDYKEVEFFEELSVTSPGSSAREEQ